MRYLALIISIVVSLSFTNCNTQHEVKSDGFVIHKGVNASHWLSQSEKRGEARRQYMTEKDFKKIAEMGFDHVRLPFDEKQLWDEDGNKISEGFELLHNGVNWCIKNKLRVIIDLHVLRSHHFNSKDNTLFSNPEAQRKFWGFWKQLSSEFSHYSTDSVAYELMNEAVAENPDDWNKLIANGIKTIRKTEPLRKIVVGSNRWQQIYTFKDLKIPENDTNLIISFHFYEPFLISHYGVWWNPMKDFKGEVNYPGLTADTNEYSNYSGDVLNMLKEQNGVYNESVFEEKFKMAADFAKEHNLPLYCGEFGCYPTTPLEMRTQLYSDYAKAFKKYDIAWAHWNYKNDFPLVDSLSLQPINELLNALMK